MLFKCVVLTKIYYQLRTHWIHAILKLAFNDLVVVFTSDASNRQIFRTIPYEHEVKKHVSPK